MKPKCAIGWCSWFRAQERLGKMGTEIKRCWRYAHIKVYQASHVWKDCRNQPSSFFGCLRKRVCSYIWLVNDEGEIHCSSLVGKSRVTPKKFLSTSRLELTAAVLSVKIACLIRKELNLGNITERFWTDSQVVLTYIRSTTKRFKVFVANQVQKIQEHSDGKSQWKYLKGRDNPVDDALRGLDPRKETSSSRWFSGPAFLWQREELWPSYNVVTCVGDDDPEIKRDVKVNAVQLVNDVLENVKKWISNWSKLKRIIALLLIYLRRFLLKVHRKKGMVKMTAKLWHCAWYSEFSWPKFSPDGRVIDNKIISVKVFLKWAEDLGRGRIILNKKSSIYKLDPYLDRHGLLRVCGRIQKSIVSEQMKHPVLLAKKKVKLQ